MILSYPALEPQPAVLALLELFATRPLVALCEWHGSQDEADFISALLHHRDFPAREQPDAVHGQSGYLSR